MDEPYSIKCKKIQLAALENRFEKLKTDYEKVSEQRDRTTNAQEINNLERQLKKILEDLEKDGSERDRLQEEIKELEANELHISTLKALQPLIDILTSVNTDTVTKAYQLSVSEGRHRQIPKTLATLVQQLDGIPGEPNAAKPLERFVNTLIQDQSLDADQRQALRVWAQAQGLISEVPICQQNEEVCLMVKVEPRSLNNPISGYLLSAVIVTDPNPLKPDVELKAVPISIPEGTDSKCAPGYSKDDLPRVLGELIAICGREHHITLTDLVVQCFLPIQLMSLPIEHGQIQISPNQKQFVGARCKAVIVRSYDRHFFPAYQLARGDWEKYWERLLACSNSRCSETLVHLDPINGRTAINWKKSKIVGCKFVEHHDQQQQEVLWEKLLGQGLPVALWMRQLGADQQTTKKIMQSATKCSITSLSMILAEQRGRALSEAVETDSLKAAPLCLLLDSPFRPFPMIDYQSA